MNEKAQEPQNDIEARHFKNFLDAQQARKDKAAKPQSKTPKRSPQKSADRALGQQIWGSGSSEIHQIRKTFWKNDWRDTPVSKQKNQKENQAIVEKYSCGTSKEAGKAPPDKAQGRGR